MKRFVTTSLKPESGGTKAEKHVRLYIYLASFVVARKISINVYVHTIISYLVMTDDLSLVMIGIYFDNTRGYLLVTLTSCLEILNVSWYIKDTCFICLIKEYICLFLHFRNIFSMGFGLFRKIFTDYVVLYTVLQTYVVF